MKRVSLFIVILVFFSLNVYCQRSEILINDNWVFFDKNTSSCTLNSIEESEGEKVNLPHTWNLDAYSTKDYDRSTKWYQRELRIPAKLINKTLYLKFEAVNSLAEVYINSKLVSTHKGGYGSFVVNISDHIQDYSSTVVLSVKVDNKNNEIPPLSGDFTIFGGIYRDVWLIATEKQHFNLSNYGSNGVFIQTPLVSDKEAQILIRGDISGELKGENLKISVNIVNKRGVTVLKKEQKIKNNSFNISKLQIEQPDLWSPDSPNLYTAQITLSDQNNKLKDKLEISFGLRWFSVDTENGFILNGKPLKLMGVCRHQDQQSVGIAVSNELHRRDMQLVKNMGANFIRLAHYQHDDAILKACDKLGLLVWEEIPIVDIIGLSDEFEENSKTALKEMVRQHYNHPSVVMWGYMNEAIIQVQYRVEKGKREKHYRRTVELAHKLEKLLKEEDSSRLSTMAYHGSQIYNEIGLNGIADIAGWNLYQGWYESDINGFDRFVDEEHRKYPDRPIIISEFGAGSDKRIHSLDPEIFDFSIEYQQKYLEHYLPAIMQRPFIIGATEWNFIDFSSASRQESMPHINNKGLVYADRTPKDVYYYFQAFLRKDTPVLHIAVDDWKKRTMISDNNMGINPIKVYSNLDDVTLFINDQQLDNQKIKNNNAIWQVRLQKGRNLIKASGIHDGQKIERFSEVFIDIVPKKITEENIDGLELAINAGSNCYFTDEVSGLCWLPDQEYSEGSWGYIGGNIFRKSPGRIGTTAEVKGTYNTPLLQTKRENPTAYRFDVPNGIYEVELSFADLYNAHPQAAYNLAKQENREFVNNQFNVYINDSLVLEKFSPYTLSGNNFTLKKTFRTEVKGNNINIRFESLHGNSFINTLKIRKI